MSAPIFLVGCGAKKAPHAAAAAELYKGDLFAKARCYAEQQAKRCNGSWAILSALHGVLSPGEVVEPYDCAMRDLSQLGQDAWADRVTDRLNMLGAGEIVLLAGRDYRAALTSWPRFRFCFPTTRAPLEGLGIGQQKAWLLQHTARPHCNTVDQGELFA